MMTAKSFSPNDITPTLISAVADYLVAKAKSQVLREQVDKIQNEVFKGFEFFDSVNGEKITDPKYIYCSDDDEGAKRFYDACEDAEIKAGIKPLSMPPGFCPALVAENKMREIEVRIIEESAEVYKMGFDGKELRHRLLCTGMKTYHEWIDATVGLTITSQKRKVA